LKFQSIQEKLGDLYQVLDCVGTQRTLGDSCVESSWSIRSNHYASPHLFINEIYRWVGKETMRSMTSEELELAEQAMR
jgi:hypothetical protein